MARITSYEDAHGNTYWVVERSSDSEGRKEFCSYQEAELYRDYLQSSENEEKSLAQNEQMIENQKRILKAQEQMSNRRNSPQYTRQILDPEYKEWLRFKKETDPNYKRWKEEEERKKAQMESERRERERENQRIHDKKILESNFHFFRRKRIKIEKQILYFDNISTIYQRLLNISFVGSRRIEYGTNWYGEWESAEFELSSGRWIIYGDIGEKTKQKYEYIKNNISEFSDMGVIEKKLLRYKRAIDRIHFEAETKKIYAIESAFDCFYRNIYNFARTVTIKYDDYVRASKNGWYNPEPRSFLKKLKIKNAILDYLKANESSYKEVNSIFINLEKMVIDLKTADIAVFQ